MTGRDYKFSLTLKGTGGFEHPWIVIKDDTVEGLQNQISDAHENDLFTAAGRAHAAFLRGMQLGSQLEATTVKVEDTPAKGSAKAKPGAAEPAAEPEAPVATPPIPEGAPTPAWKRNGE